MLPILRLNTKFKPDLDDVQKKVAALNSLVQRLPRPNWSLLRTLSAFLINVINNADVNKMTVRNGKSYGLIQ